MLTKESPPVIVEPEAKDLLVGDMPAIRDMILDCAAKVSDARGIPIKQVRVQRWENPEGDRDDIAFVFHLVSDEETAFACWDAISEEIEKVKDDISEDMLHTLNYYVGVGVEWR